MHSVNEKKQHILGAIAFHFYSCTYMSIKVKKGEERHHSELADAQRVTNDIK